MNDKNNKKSGIPTRANWTIRPTKNVSEKKLETLEESELKNTNTMSWGVGSKKNNDKSAPIPPAVIEELEVLDENFDEPVRPHFEPIKQPEPKNLEPAHEEVDDKSNLTNDYKASNRNTILSEEELNKPVSHDPNWMSNQPLSSAKLGVSAIEDSKIARDVEKKGKFFNNAKEIENKNKALRNNKKVSPPIKKELNLNDPLIPMDEGMLLKSFIRYDYSKLTMSIFSFKAALFKGVYFIYNKLYLIGLILVAIELYILTMLPLQTSLALYGALSLLCGFVANPIYLSISKTRVKQIRHAKKNRKLNQAQIMQICSKKGGTAFIISFLVEVAFLSSLIYLSMYQFPSSTVHQLYDLYNTYNKESKKPKYDGVIDRLSFEPTSLLTINMPEEFTKETGKIYKYYYSPNGKEEIKTCSITISRINKFSDAKDFISQYKNIEKIDDSISELKKGSLTWYSIDHSKKSYIKRLNATNVGNNVILLEYYSGLEVEEGICEKYYNDIFNSIDTK